MVIDDQINNAAEDKRIVNLFTGGSDHRNLSVIYIVQNFIHQEKGSEAFVVTVITWFSLNIRGINCQF